MRSIRITLVVLFLIFSMIEIYAALTNQTGLKFVSTPLLMPLLAAFYIMSVARRNWLVITALALSFVGDLLNQWQSNENVFMIETGVFLLAFGCYMIALSRPTSHLRRVPTFVYLLSILYVAYGIGVYFLLRPYLGEMELPSIVYLAVVSLMGVSALTRAGDFRGSSFWFPVVGTVLMIASDTFLAVNAFKYNGQLPFGDFLTTIFYIPAQALIVLGFVPFERSGVQRSVPA